MKNRLVRKYVKPKSVTWWAGFVPLCTGCFIAAEPVHQLEAWAEFARNAAGLPAPVLINGGLAAIGLRGKDD